jgi:hypothetical protein
MRLCGAKVSGIAYSASHFVECNEMSADAMMKFATRWRSRCRIACRASHDEEAVAAGYERRLGATIAEAVAKGALTDDERRMT